TFNLNITECDSVEILNQWYYASTTFNDTIFGGAGNGCDSVVIYNVIIHYSDSTFANFTTCNPNDVGVVVQNLINQFGCDSVHTITTILGQLPDCNNPPFFELRDTFTDNLMPVTMCAIISDPDVGDTFTATLCNNPE